MALQGTYTKYSYTNHPTEVTSYEATYPVDISPSHEDYEKRGTTVRMYEPKQIEASEEIKDVYINIKSINTFYHFGSIDDLPNKSTTVNIQYIIYKDKDIYDSDPENIENVLEKVDNLGVRFSFEQLGNMFSSSYAHINSITGLESLTSI